jgi:hypothetical protein
MKKILFIIILITFCIDPPAFCQVDNAVLRNVVPKLKKELLEHITEKVYLHFDKPYYAAGDTLYFKAYVTAGEKHELSNLSGVLHVDLINGINKIDQSIKLQLINGIAWGDFALPDSLPKGDYRVRAYTRWMLNEGDEGFFDQTIPIASARNNKIKESGEFAAAMTKGKADLQFFPEGGSLVTGVSSKVAFKAIGASGMGVDVKGELLDNANKVVTTFSSSHLGMGYFYITPAEEQNYKAKISYPNGSINIIDLPKAQPMGIVLSVNNDSLPKASVKIEASKTWYQSNKNKIYTLLIYSGGITTSVPCTLDSNIITLDILKRHLQTGIATVTLFSPAGEPLCERLFFVQNYDQLNINLSSDRPIYAAKREKVNIKLNVKTRADSASIGQFSVSVTDESKVSVDENDEHTILTNLLLTSDLRGYVEEPNYYFANITDKTSSDLDLVMLTHGYRRFEWKKLLNDEYPPITYLPEKGIEITGMAKNGLGKPLVNGRVSLIQPNGGSLLMQQTDDKGNFNFSNLAFTDSTKFVLQAVNAKGKNSTTIVYNKEKPGFVVTSPQTFQYDTINRPKAAYLENSSKQYDQAVQYGKASGIMLKVVKVRQSKKHIIDTNYRSSSLLGPGHADQVLHRKEIMQVGGTLATSLNGRLRNVRFSNPQAGDGGNPGLIGMGPMLVVIDGVQMGNYPINHLNPNDIETIEVYEFGNAAIYGFNSGNGVLIITTRQGGDEDPKDIQALGILPITVNGFYKAREFYLPKYDHPNDSFNRPDLRSTIFWKPEIVTDKDGNASFDYYNADGTGTYRVVVDGIDNNGNLGRQVYRYEVK